MRTWVFLGLLLGLALVTGSIAGCATVTKSSDEVVRTYRQVLDHDMRTLSEDWNYLWLMDRQYRMSKWHTR